MESNSKPPTKPTPSGSQIDTVKTIPDGDRIFNDIAYPKHYCWAGLDPMDIIELLELPYHLAEAFGYIVRFQHKHVEEPVKDLHKARWFVDRYATNVDYVIHRNARKSPDMIALCLKRIRVLNLPVHAVRAIEHIFEIQPYQAGMHIDRLIAEHSKRQTKDEV